MLLLVDRTYKTPNMTIMKVEDTFIMFQKCRQLKKFISMSELMNISSMYCNVMDIFNFFFKFNFVFKNVVIFNFIQYYL